MFDAVTKYNVEVNDIEQVAYLLTQAFKEATSSTPGPVHVDFLGHEGELTDEAEADLSFFYESSYKNVPAKRPQPILEEIDEVVEALRKAERPVLIAGRGAVISGAQAEVKKLAEAINIPVGVSMDAKGILPDTHPLYIGPVGTYCRPCANEVVFEADFVFFIGCGTGDQVTKSWTLPRCDVTVAQLDINPSEIGRNYPGAITVLGDARNALSVLNTKLKNFQKNETWCQKARTYVKEYLDSIAFKCNLNAVPVRPERLCREISEILPDNAVLVADTGFSAIWAGTLIDFTSPYQIFLRAAGSLGWAFPAAIGAKCALPDRPVICFTGDGAFWYHLSELETAVRCKIPTVTVINNNSVLCQCKQGVRRAYRNEGGMEDLQYRFNETNFAKFASEIGAFGTRVERPGDIGPALLKALSSGKPAIIDVVTDSEAFPYPSNHAQ
jgi:acetolactate synthase-1/2/3 large subunit